MRRRICPPFPVPWSCYQSTQVAWRCPLKIRIAQFDPRRFLAKRQARKKITTQKQCQRFSFAAAQARVTHQTFLFFPFSAPCERSAEDVILLLFANCLPFHCDYGLTGRSTSTSTCKNILGDVTLRCQELGSFLTYRLLRMCAAKLELLRKTWAFPDITCTGCHGVGSEEGTCSRSSTH